MRPPTPYLYGGIDHLSLGEFSLFCLQLYFFPLEKNIYLAGDDDHVRNGDKQVEFC